jgi:predicted metal-dependent HD superfamily phosphohydrolase
MSEVVELGPRPETRKQAVNLLVQRGIILVDLRYGLNGTFPKAYHNIAHTTSVIEATEQICDLAISRGKMQKGHKDFLMVAAAFHDVVQDHGNDNEELSADQATGQMLETGLFNEIDVRTTQDAIKATQLKNEKGLITQSSGDSYLTKVVADADLATLGGNSEIYLISLFNLHEELAQTSEVGSMYKFIREQAMYFNGNHSFLTEEANELFPNKQANIDYVLEYVENNKPLWLN